MNQDDIIKLNFPDAVRCRPGMYIGSTENPDVLLREIIDNSIDECYKYESCNTIIIYNENNAGLVIDNGRGIPIKAAFDNSEYTMAYQSAYDLHAGSKFHKTEVGIGQNGVGSSCVNALSSYHILAVRATDSMIEESTEKVKSLRKLFKSNNNLYYVLIAECGVLKEEILVEKSKLNKYIKNYEIDLNNIDIGTLVYFEPDDSIFSTSKLHIPGTLQYFKCIASRIYNKEVKVIINGLEYEDSFQPFEMEFVTNIHIDNPNAKNKEIKYLISFKFNEDFDQSGTSGSVNGLICNMGWHINYAKICYKLAYDYVFPGLDYNSKQDKGIEFNIICLCPEPTFSSQTKERCADIDGLLSWKNDELKQAFIDIINKNYQKFIIHNKKLIEFINMTRDLSRIETIRSNIPVIGLDGSKRVNAIVPLNVKTCSSKDRESCELFIVEGKSAAGSIIKARDTRYQAVLPLRGKPLNAAGLDILTILENQEMKDLIATLGTGVDERFSLEAVQYGKVIITADADPDGSNIASLVLGLFFSHMKYLINAGMVYICESPLYKQCDNYFYAGDEDKLDKSKPIQRYKGLGELNPEDVKYSITNSETRRLIRITDIGEGMTNALRLITSTWARKLLMMESGIIDEENQLNYSEVINGNNN